MKRYLITGAVCAALLLLLWSRRESHRSVSDTAANPQALGLAGPGSSSDDGTPPTESSPSQADSITASTSLEHQSGSLQPEYLRYPDVPVWFYGLVVDQDTNALPNVKVQVEVLQWDPGAPPDEVLKKVHVERHTGADGRFEVNGVSGHSVTIQDFTKDAYEPEYWRRNYGEYGALAGSVGEPVVFRMWSTNLHEPLISGDKAFVVIPDGRHYALDLFGGTIAEGDAGDLVAWIKRAEPVTRGQRFDWSCELSVPGGGLVEDRNYVMYRAPEAGYTNKFSCAEEANPYRWSSATGDKRFYLRLRSGQMYGRIVVNLHADGRGRPALIQLSYAVNPSGSRLLR